MELSIFESKTYKQYLKTHAGGKSARRGMKSAMAEVTGCQATYVTQVLYGSANFSLEQAEALSRFFHHTQEETKFFLLMVQRDRAGTKTLREHFQNQMDEILRQRLVLTQRLGPGQELSEDLKSIYYSSWLYAAVHIAVSIPELQTPGPLAQRLSVPVSKIVEALEFLLRARLIEKHGERYRTATDTIRLKGSSHHILQHHANWRHRAIDSLDREIPSELHYSGVYSLSEEDALVIKDRLLEILKEVVQTMRDSKEESLRCLSLDFFDVLRS